MAHNTVDSRINPPVDGMEDPADETDGDRPVGTVPTRHPPPFVTRHRLSDEKLTQVVSNRRRMGLGLADKTALVTDGDDLFTY